MTIDKLPSGSYRIRHTENKKTYSMTVPYKPSTHEAFTLIQNKINHTNVNAMTFREAAVEYVESKKNVLSPSSVRNYNSIIKNLPEQFLNTDIHAIDELTVQKLINKYASDHKPKTVHNLCGFVLSVLRLFLPKMDISVTLPQKQRQERYTPSTEDVMRIVEASKNTPYSIPIRLACLGLRNSEICALTIFDLKDDRLTINKACVRSENGYVIKDVPKTDASNRIIVLPHDLAEDIREQGFIYKGYPQQIDKHLRRVQKRLNIPSFGIHRLRHFFASYAHDTLKLSDATIQALGGWNTDNVMKSTYRHAMNENEVKEQIASNFSFL